MFRYRLRTLLIVLGVAPPLLAAWWMLLIVPGPKNYLEIFTCFWVVGNSTFVAWYVVTRASAYLGRKTSI